ncbi:MAG: hypothetical protein J6I72_10380 [Muribaculaceae bacterium]|nr:hypothetical protein [Muribaculaceae bacterium]
MNTTRFVYRYRWKLSTALITAAALLVVLPVTAQQQMRKAERQQAEHMNHHEMVKADFHATPSFAESLAAQPTMASNPRKAAPPRRATDYTGGVYDMVDAYVDADRTTTICNGTATHNSIPFRTYYFDTEETSSQMIYPASMLTALKPGDKIKSITFYTNNSTINQRLGTARVDVRIGETTATTISNSKDDMDSKRGGITGSFSSYLTTGSNTVTITFTKPYTWNGGNLIIDTYALVSTKKS